MSKHHRHHRHYDHLHVPDTWEQYWSKYPNGYTMLESLIDWVSQTNKMISSFNNLSDEYTTLNRNMRALEKELRASWTGYKEHTEKTYTDFRDEILTMFNQWVATIEPTIQDEVVGSLTAWLEDGTLADIINEDVFDMKANASDLQALEGRTGELEQETSKIEHTIDRYVSPQNFDTLTECYDYAHENGLTIQADELHLTEDTSLRGVGLDINIIYLNDFTFEFGGFAHTDELPKDDKRYNNEQKIGKIIADERGEYDKVFIRGAAQQQIHLGGYSGHVEIRMNDFDAQGRNRFSSYSNFHFGNLVGLRIKEDEGSGTTNPDQVLWFSENKIYLQNVMYLELGDEGGYHHSLNTFYGGVFESGSKTWIKVHSGRDNTFLNIRGEAQPLEITFGEGTRYNKVEIGHYTYKPVVIDKGYLNTVDSVTERNNRLVLNEVLSTNVISSGGMSRLEYIQHPFRNLAHNTEGGYFEKSSNEHAGDVFYETPYLRNPSQVKILVEATLLDSNGFGVGYRYYDDNYNDITSELSGEITSHVLTTDEDAIYTMGEGQYVGPSTYLQMYSNNTTTGSEVEDDILSLIPGGQWAVRPSEITERVKYIKFFVGSASNNEGSPRFNDLIISVYNMANNYHLKYFGNGLKEFKG